MGIAGLRRHVGRMKLGKVRAGIVRILKIGRGFGGICSEMARGRSHTRTTMVPSPRRSSLWRRTIRAMMCVRSIARLRARRRTKTCYRRKDRPAYAIDRPGRRGNRAYTGANSRGRGKANRNRPAIQVPKVVVAKSATLERRRNRLFSAGDQRGHPHANAGCDNLTLSRKEKSIKTTRMTCLEHGRTGTSTGNLC